MNGARLLMLKALWIAETYNNKIEAVKSLFSFKDNVEPHFYLTTLRLIRLMRA